MHDVHFTKQALQDIKALPRFIKKQVQTAIDNLASDPTREGLELERELKGLWSCHVGDYRIICEVQPRILIYAVGHRKDIYLSTFLQDQAEQIRKRLF